MHAASIWVGCCFSILKIYKVIMGINIISYFFYKSVLSIISNWFG